MKKVKNKIIRYISVATLLLACILKADAQAEVGLRLMPTFSSFQLKTSSGGDVKGHATFGFGAGGFLGINFSDHVGVQGEVIYNTISQKYTESDVERKVTLKYINIPVLLSLNTGKSKMINLNYCAGPQIGISAGTNLTTSGGDGTNTQQAIVSVKKGDLGFAYGAGLDFGLNPSHSFRLGVGFRGVYGLFDISDDSKTVQTNSYYILDRTHVKTYSAYLGLSYLFI